MLVRKHICSPGRVWFVNRETGMPACLDATAERIRKWHDNGNAMLGIGLSIPVPVEHKEPGQPGAGPMTDQEKRAKLLKDNAGWVQKFEMEGDALFSVLDIQDESIVPKLPKTIRWTSPWITSFMDGSGKVWDEAIGHVALTSHPRITQQHPFPTVQAAMSFATAAQATKALPKSGVSISRAGQLAKDGAVYRPAYPMAFSLWSGGIMLADDEMPKEKPEGKPEAKKLESKEGAPPKEGEVVPEAPQIGPDGQPVPESLVDADGDISVWDVICDLLASEGYDFPEGTTGDNFAERAYKLLMDRLKGKAMDVPDPTNQPNENPPNQLPGNPPRASAVPVVQESQPMYMSIEQMQAAIAAEENASTKAILSAMLSMQVAGQTKAQALEKNAFDTARAKRDERIARLTKRAKNKAFTEQITAAAQGAQFAMDDNGVVKDAMAPYLDMMEAGIRDVPVMLSMPGVNVSIEAHPADTTDGVNNERAQQIAEEQMKSSGIEVPAKVA